jgi:23S rRNA (adenine2030-N6)-methyltransferase
MNYRHSYHAGNHADILKHIVLARVLARMLSKDKPVHFIDAHAGIGVYDLMGEAAGKTLEWQTGIAKMQAPFADPVELLLAPFRDAVQSVNGAKASLRYPGSPAIAAQMLRAHDRLWLNELHPDDHTTLAGHFAGDRRVRVTLLDATAAIKSLLPVKPGRALVLLDPPYEDADEIQKVAAAVRHALQRMRTAVVMIWYPIKAPSDGDRLCKELLTLNPPDLLRVDLSVQQVFAKGGLAGSGVLIINAPWKVDEDVSEIVPALAKRLGVGKWGRSAVSWVKRSA